MKIPQTMEEARALAAKVDFATSGFVSGILGNIGLIMLVIGLFGPGTRGERLWCLFSGALHLVVAYFIYRRASKEWTR